ncbi:MAG: TldD/PmbA family protein, partial [Nitrosopumilus sp.]|nr:TldD/PmbA family protein [Nitrosopumilus sp.]
MDSNLQDLADKAVNYAKKSGVQYCDARAEQQEKKSVLIENNQIDHIRTNNDKGIGIRIIKNGVWSFCSISNPQSFNQIKEAVDNSIRSATYNKKNEKNVIDLY